MNNPIFKKTGELHFEPGGRAVVYKVEDSKNNVKAIKLFTVNRDSLFQKYGQISNFRHNFSFLKYFVDFQFKEKLIYCSDINSDKNDNIFPGLIMEWAEGKTLGSLVKDLCEQDDKTSLKKLTEQFKELSLFIFMYKKWQSFFSFYFNFTSSFLCYFPYFFKFFYSYI